MALQPEISLGVQTPKPPNPLEAITRVLTMRDMLSREALRRQEIATGQENARRIGLENEAFTRKNAGDDLLRKTTQKYTTVNPDTGKLSIDHDAVEGEMTAAGFPEHALTYSKSRKEVEDNSYNAAIHQLKIYNDKQKVVGNELGSIIMSKDPQQKALMYMGAMGRLKGQGLVDGETLKKYGLPPQYDPSAEPVLQQLYLASRDNPGEALKQLMEERRAESKEGRDIETHGVQMSKEEAETLQKEIENESQLGGVATNQQQWDQFRRQLTPARRVLYPDQFSKEAAQAVSLMGVKPDVREQMKIAKNEEELAYKAKQGDKTAQGALDLLQDRKISLETWKERAKAAAEWGILGFGAPGMPAVEGGPVSGGVTPRGPGAPVGQPNLFQGSGQLINGRDEKFLSQMPQAAQGLVRDLAEYRMAPPTQRALGAKQLEMLMAWAQIYNPSFEPSLFNIRQRFMQDFMADKGSNVLRSNVQLFEHMDRMGKSITDLGNYGSNSPLARGPNKIKNVFSSAAEQKRFNDDKQALFTELDKLFKGTGTASEKEIEAWKEGLNVDDSIDVQRESLKELAHLTVGAMRSQIDRYVNNMGEAPRTKVLGRDTRGIMRKFGLDPKDVEPEELPNPVPGALPNPTSPAARRMGASTAVKKITPTVMSRMRKNNPGVSDADIVKGLEGQGWSQ